MNMKTREIIGGSIDQFYDYFSFCVNCFKPEYEKGKGIEGTNPFSKCKCGKKGFDFIIAHTEEEYDKLEEEYQEKYLNLKRKKKLKRIL